MHLQRALFTKLEPLPQQPHLTLAPSRVVNTLWRKGLVAMRPPKVAATEKAGSDGAGGSPLGRAAGGN